MGACGQHRLLTDCALCSHYAQSDQKPALFAKLLNVDFASVRRLLRVEKLRTKDSWLYWDELYNSRRESSYICEPTMEVNHLSVSFPASLNRSDVGR